MLDDVDGERLVGGENCGVGADAVALDVCGFDLVSDWIRVNVGEDELGGGLLAEGDAEG